jgi:hypothetical protein
MPERGLRASESAAAFGNPALTASAFEIHIPPGDSQSADGSGPACRWNSDRYRAVVAPLLPFHLDDFHVARDERIPTAARGVRHYDV